MTKKTLYQEGEELPWVEWEKAEPSLVQQQMDARLDQFDRHRGELLQLLHDAAQGHSFDEDKLWRYLANAAQFYVATERVIEDDKETTDRIEELGKIAATARKLRKLVERCDLDLSDAWFESDPAGELAVWKPTHLANGMEHLANFADHINILIEDLRNQRRRGRPGRLPPGTVRRLAYIFREATERRPGRGKGPFQRLVNLFLETMGRPLSEEVVIDTIQRVLKRGDNPLKIS